MTTTPAAEAGDAFVYGLRFRALGGVPGLPTAASDDPSGPVVHVRQVHHDPPPPVPGGCRPARTVRVLADGRTLEIEPLVTAGGSIGGTATLYGPPLESADLAHPYLTPVAVPFTRWNGREAFHSGVFATQDGAWVVRGVRTAGKSSLMAALAAQDIPVLADDMAMTDGERVYAGPRSIDLREPIPGVDLPRRPVRGGDRTRLLLPDVPRSVRLAGWIFLHWSEHPAADVELRPVPPAALLARLAKGRAHADWDTDPSLLLRLALRPAYDLVRPRRWDAVPAVVDALRRLPGHPGPIPRQHTPGSRIRPATAHPTGRRP